jgi:hypothetical protein
MVPIVAAALLALAGTAASAQPTQKAVTPNPLKQEDVAQIEGTRVYGGDNGEAGRVSAVLMNPDTKRIERLVVTTGGVLGVGGHRAAIPVEEFLWDDSKGVFRLPMTIVNLRALPEWTEGGETMTGSSRPPQHKTPSADAGR